MKVTVDVYTTELPEALEIYTLAMDDGATDVRLSSEHDYHSKDLECYNISFEVDHTADVLERLDDGPFYRDREEAGTVL